MCYHNYTQYSGCGHFGEAPERYTLCNPVYAEVYAKRGPSSPLPVPPEEYFKQPMRRSTTKRKTRFFSMSNVLERSGTTKSFSSRRAVSGPENGGGSRDSRSSFAEGRSGISILEHELKEAAQRCPNIQDKTQVGNNAPGQVCEECRKWIDSLRIMLKTYEEGKGVRGTKAFEEFLKDRPGPKEIADLLGLWPPPRPNLAVTRRDEDELYDMRPV